MARKKSAEVSVAEAKLKLRAVIEQPHQAVGYVPLVVSQVRRHPKVAVFAGLIAGFTIGASPKLRQSLMSVAVKMLRHRA